MKDFFKNILKLSGYELRKITNNKIEIGSDKRPVGRIDFLLEDIKFRGLNCKTILDVGANAASWSRMAKKIFPSANFYMIEPQIEMKENLEKFCNEFNNSFYFLAGAGAKKDILTLTVWDDLEGSSFLPDSSDKLKHEGKQREVEIITIDDLIESSRMPIPDLIKIDIQGFELEALKGAERTYGFTEAFIIEVSLFSYTGAPGMPVLSDIVSFMLERDYVIYDFGGFLRRPFDGALGQCDICFVKRNGLLRNSNNWD